MMRAAFDLLAKLTEKWPTKNDASRHHILLTEEDGETRLLVRIFREGEWEALSFESTDLDRPVDDLVADIAAIFDARGKTS